MSTPLTDQDVKDLIQEKINEYSYDIKLVKLLTDIKNDL